MHHHGIARDGDLAGGQHQPPRLGAPDVPESQHVLEAAELVKLPPCEGRGLRHRGGDRPVDPEHDPRILQSQEEVVEVTGRGCRLHDVRRQLGLVAVLVEERPRPAGADRVADAERRLLGHRLVRPAPVRDRMRRLLDAARTGMAVREDTHFDLTRVLPVLRRTLRDARDGSSRAYPGPHRRCSPRRSASRASFARRGHWRESAESRRGISPMALR